MSNLNEVLDILQKIRKYKSETLKLVRSEPLTLGSQSRIVKSSDKLKYTIETLENIENEIKQLIENEGEQYV